MSIPSRIARLETTGATDTTFDPGAGLNAAGHCVTVLPGGGRVIAGGAFTVAAGAARAHVAVFEPDGALHEAAPEADDDVFTLAAQADGKVLIGGAFTTLGGEPRGRIARLKGDLTVEAAYHPNANGAVRTLAAAADGKTVCGGGFTSMGGVARVGLARLYNQIAAEELTVESAAEVTWLRGASAQETQRVTFEISTDSGETWSALGGTVERAGEGGGGWKVTGLSLSGSGQIRARAWPAEGRSQGLREEVLAFDFAPEIALSHEGASLTSGGAAFDFGGVQTGAVADRAFVISNLGLVPLSLTGEDRVALSGTSAADFTVVSQPPAVIPARSQAAFVLRFAPTTTGAKTAALSIASDDGDEDPFTVPLTATATKGPGARDAAFSPLLNGAVLAAAASADRLLIGGAFTTVTGVSQKHRARLSLGGALTPEAKPAFGKPVTGIAMMPDGGLFLCGDFTAPRTRLARLTAAGDLAAPPLNVNQRIHAMVVQADGALIIGGEFTTVKGVSRAGLARILPGGTLDLSWNPNVPAAFLALQSDGKLLVSPLAAAPPLRLHADGSRDTSFQTAGVQRGGALMATAGGKILAAAQVAGEWALHRLNADGSFDNDWEPFMPGGAEFKHFALQADGRLLLSFQEEGLTKLVRLQADGTPDTSFITPDSMPVTSLALGPQGQIYAGGKLTLDGATVQLARLINDAGSGESTLTVNDPATITWTRKGIVPEAQDVVLQLSQDEGQTWAALGGAGRAADGWRLSGLELPAAGLVRGRARIFHSGACSALLDQQTAIPAGLAVPDLDVEYPAGTVFTVRGVSPRAGTPAAELLRFPAALPPPAAGLSGQSSEMTVILRNRGLAHLTNIVASVSEHWSIVSSPPASLPPGGAATLVLRFSPPKKGYTTGRLTVTSSVPGLKRTYPVSMRGPGLAAPVIASLAAAAITTTQARLRATVTPNDDDAQVYFRYKKQSQDDSAWITAPLTTAPLKYSGFSALAAQQDISALTPGTAYHYRAFIINSFNPGAPIAGPLTAFTTLAS